MAQADLGLRLLLQDNASTGLAAFQMLLRDLISTANLGSGGMQDFASQIAAQEAAAAAAGTQVETLAAQIESLALKSQGADASLAMMMADLNASGNLGAVQGVQAMQTALSDTRMELANAQTQLDIWIQKLMDSGGTDMYAAQQVSFYRSEVARLQADGYAQSVALEKVNQDLLQQATNLTNAQSAAQSYQQQMNSASAGLQAASNAQYAASQSAADLAAAQGAAAARASQLTAASGLLAGGAVGLGLVSFATGEAVKQASNLQDAMANLTIAFHLTSQQTSDMSDSLTKVASNSRFSEKDVADAFTAMAEYGQKADDVMGTNGLGQTSVNLAEAIQSQAVPAAQLLSQTLTVFKANASDATDYANLLDYAFYHGIPSVSELSQVIQNVGGKASETGASFDQLVAVMDFLTRSGLSASMASTSLRYILSSFSNPTAAASKALTDIGLIVINQTSPAFEKFQADLEATAKAAGGTATPFDGTLTSLQAMFKQAQALHMPIAATDKTFMQWATSLHLVSNNLMNANGKLNPLFTNISQLGEAIKKLPKDQQLEAIGALFNVRSGQDAQLLLQNIDGVMGKLKQYDQEAKNYQKGNQVKKDATTQTSTLPGEMAKLNTTLGSFMAKVALPFADWLAKVTGQLNTLASHFNGADPKVRTFATTFAKVAAVLSVFAIVGGITVMVMLGIGVAFFSVAGIALGVVIAIMAIAAVVALVVANWGAISGFFVGLWRTVSGAVVSGVTTAINAIKSWIGQTGAWFQSLGRTILSGIQIGFNAAYTFVVSWGARIKNAVVNGFNSSVAAVKNFGSSILNGVKSGFNSVLSFVGGMGANFHKAMGWMYNHNYYWQAMVDGVHKSIKDHDKAYDAFSKSFQKNWNTFWGDANKTASDNWKSISTSTQAGMNATSKWWNDGLNVQKAYWSKHWNELMQESNSAMNGIRSGISSGWNWAMGYINMGVNAARGLFNYLFGWVPGAASSAFHSAASGISSGMDIAKSAVNSGITWINNLVGGWGAQLQQFGSNAVKLFADGIRAGIGWVNDAVHSVASSIWTTLGFHSPPKGGILSDSDQYMPNMMRMYGDGIRNNMHHVRSAVGDVASTIHKGFTTPMTQAIGTAYAASSAGGPGGGVNPTTTVNVNMDSKLVGQVVIDRVSGQLVMNGMNRMNR